MSVNIESVINWFVNNEGRLTYSMYGSRNGADGTADCSGSMTQALYEAGASKPAYLYSTETIHQYLLDNGFVLSFENTSWNALRGDIVIFGKQGASAGEFGHIGIITSDDPNANFISTCYWTGGEYGTAVQDLPFDTMYNQDGQPYFYVYRYNGNNMQPEAPSQPIPAPTPAKPKTAIEQFKAANNVFTAYGTFKADQIVQYNGIWQVINENLAGGNGNANDNGVPLAILNNVTRGDSDPTQVGDELKFNDDNNHGTIDEYDEASNGVGIKFGDYGIVWFDANALLNL